MSLRLESTVGARGQTVIPKPIRDQLRLRHGEKVYFRLEGERIVIEREDPVAVYDAFVNESEKRPLAPIDWNERYAEQHQRRAGHAAREDP